MKTDDTITVLTVILLTLAASSCRKVEIDSQEKENFFTCTEVGFYPGGEPRFIYVESIHQKCVNPSRRQFRIQTDSQDTCMNITLEKRLQKEGEVTLSQVDYYDDGLKISDQCELECSIKKDGKLWLWDGYAKTGLIISDY